MPDIKVLSLNSSNLPRQPSHRFRYEKPFIGACELLNKVLPEQFDKAEDIRAMLFSKRKDKLIFHVAMTPLWKVVGVAMTDYIPKMNIAFFYRIAIDPEYRRRGIGGMLVQERLNAVQELSEKKGGVKYIVTEILRPKMLFDLSEESLWMRNVIRPTYHQNVTQLKAIVSAADEVIGSEWYIFVIRNMRRPEAKTISAKKLEPLLYWNYKLYNHYSDETYKKIIDPLADEPLRLMPLTEAAMLDPAVARFVASRSL